MTANSSQLPEFIFGTLSTSQGRLQQVCTQALGLRHDHTYPLDPLPEQPITIKVKGGNKLAVKSLTLFYTTDGTTPSIESISIPMERTELKWDTLQWSYLETWSAVIPGQPQGTHIQYLIQGITITGELIYCPYVDLEAVKASAESDNFDIASLEQLWRRPYPQIYGFYVDREIIPQWLREGIIYQVFVDRFAPSPGKEFAQTSTRSDFYGGTLAGVIAKLDYLQSLGITCIWLTPIFPSPSHHGYDPIAHDTIEPRLGTEEDWQNLINGAHQRGIKIIFDYVVNHISNEHPAFQEAQKDINSSSYSWFRFRKWPNDYECFFDVPGQPEINSDNPETRSYFISNACQWLKKGADGFRLDYAQGVTHAFWSAFRANTRAINPQSITIAEITSTPEVIGSYEGRMDGCLDFKLLELLRGFFAFDSFSVSEFAQGLEQHYSYFQSRLVLPSFLDNHDMNRFLWIVKGDTRRLKLAALCQFTLPSPPIIYYGTEVGLSQIHKVGPLEESRLPMIWGEEQDQELWQFYQDLIRWRKQNLEILTQRQTLLIDDQLCLYGYQIGSYGVVLNNSPETVTWTFPQGISGELVLASDQNKSTSELELPGFSGGIWLL